MYDDIINEYLGEVTKEMSVRQRGDVARELRTHILDSADALAAERKVPVDAAIVREVIARMGPAEKIAALYPSKKTFFKKNGMWDAIKALAMLAIVFLMVPLILALFISPSVAETTQILVNIAGALVLAIIVIAVIFFCIYLYESRLKATHEARLKRLDKSLKDAASPLRISITIIMTLVWIALINLFWTRLPFIVSFGQDARLVPVLSTDFEGFLFYINILSAATIIVLLLYLVLSQKWIAAVLEALLGVAGILLIAWMLTAFPFNPELSIEVATLIKVLLAGAIVGSLFGTAKKFWQAAQLFIHGQFRKNGAV